MFINAQFIDEFEFKLTVESLSLHLSRLKAAENERHELIKTGNGDAIEKMQRIQELTTEITKESLAVNKMREALHLRFATIKAAFDL